MIFPLKMRILSFIVVFLSTFPAFTQPPSGYYDTATGSRFELKTQLFNIIKDHNVRLYNELWSVYPLSDADLYYNMDGTVLDIYSENPSGTDPYSYIFFEDQCGNFNAEGQCYNREHLMPSSVFGGALPMFTDIHHIFPTDGWVNNLRDVLPFGIVNNPSTVSQNGSKRGSNSSPGYTAGAFEVIDDFKGDVARAMLYFGTRYEDQIAGWSHPMLNNTSQQVFSDWFLALLLEWHEMDPPSEREKNRNNVAYEFQGNRNPFVDRPEFVNRIWNPETSVLDWTTHATINIYPNPALSQEINLSSTLPFESISVFNVKGEMIRNLTFPKGDTNTKITDLNPGFYIIQTKSRNELHLHKLIVN